MPSPEPLRTLEDGTPCWCLDPRPDGHEPRCEAHRAFTGTKGGLPSWLSAGNAENLRARTEALQRAFLNAYAVHGVISIAARDAGVRRQTVLDWSKADPGFAERMAQAKEEATDMLEREAVRRAAEGWEEPVFQGGREVGAVRKYSDAMLALVLKANRPKLYRENIRAEVSGPDGGPILHELLGNMDDHERILLRKVLEDAIRAQAESEVPAAAEVQE